MFDLTCNYLDDDDIDHEAEKQWIFKTLHQLEKEEEIKSHRYMTKPLQQD